MRRITHVTPRYIYNRVREAVYQRRHPDHPWLNPDVIKLLQTMLLKTDAGFEWGSGRSTRWFADRLKQLTSVESDPIWYERVKSTLERDKVDNVDYRLHTDLDREGESAYVHAADQVPNSSLGFVLVDGYLRERCMLAAIPKIAPGGILMLDNANWYVDHQTRSPDSRYRKGPPGELARKSQEELRGWRLIWTTGGVTDAALWIRPGA